MQPSMLASFATASAMSGTLSGHKFAAGAFARAAATAFCRKSPERGFAVRAALLHRHEIRSAFKQSGESGN